MKCIKESTLFFRPNNHSKYQINWKAASAEDKDLIFKLISSNYRFNKIDKNKIYQVCEWEKMSNNFRVKVFFGRNWKEVLFRKHIQLQDRESIDILDRTFEFLRKNNVFVPRIIKTKKGKTSFFDRKNFYVMYEFLAGNHYKGTKKELKEVASKIALLHKVLKIIPIKKKIEKKPLLLSPWTVAGWKKLLKAAETKEREIDLLLQKNGDFILKETEQIEKELKKNPEVRKQVIHSDLHPQNTIFEKGKLKAILDFEGVRIGELCRDIGNACHRFVRQFVVFQGKNWKKTLPTGLKIFVQEYIKVNPLTKKEISLMPLFIKDELLRKIYKDLNLYYFKNYSKNIEGGELEKKLNLLKEAKIIEKII